MKKRLEKKIWSNWDNPKMHYSINQKLMATRGLFLSPIRMKNGCRYYQSYFCGKIKKYIN
jgi:hypothetical protein